MRRATGGRCVSGRCSGVRESSSQPLTPKGTAAFLHCPDPRKARATFQGACPRRPRPGNAGCAVHGRPGARRAPPRGGRASYGPPGARTGTPASARSGSTRPERPPRRPPASRTRLAPPAPRPRTGALRPATERYRPTGQNPIARRPRAGVPGGSAVRPAQGAQRSTRAPRLCAGLLTESRMHNHLFSANFIPLPPPCRNGRSTPLPPGRKRPRGTILSAEDGTGTGHQGEAHFPVRPLSETLRERTLPAKLPCRHNAGW